MKRIWKRILAVLTVLLLLSPDFAQVVQAAVEFEPAATLSITGTATEGETLQAVMNGETPTGVTFEWLRSDNGGSELDGAVIDAAKESSYTLTAADVGKHIFVKVTGDGEAYSAENYVFSGKTKAVEAAVSEEDTGDEDLSEPETDTNTDTNTDDEDDNGTDEQKTEDTSVSENAADLEIIDNTLSGNGVSDNSISDNSVSNNGVSENWIREHKVVTGASGMGAYATGSVLSVLGVTGMSKCTWYHTGEKQYPETEQELQDSEIVENSVEYTTNDNDLNKYMFAVYEKTGDTKKYVSDIYEYPIVNYEPTISVVSGSMNEPHINSDSFNEPVYTQFNCERDANKNDALYYDYNVNVDGNCIEYLKEEYPRTFIELNLELPSDMEEGSLRVIGRTKNNKVRFKGLNYVNIPNEMIAQSDSSNHVQLNIPLEEGAVAVQYMVGPTAVVANIIIKKNDSSIYLTDNYNTFGKIHEDWNDASSYGHYINNIYIPGLDKITSADISMSGGTLCPVKNGSFSGSYYLGNASFTGGSTEDVDDYINVTKSSYQNGEVPIIRISQLKAFPEGESINLPVKSDYAGTNSMNLTIDSIFGSPNAGILFYENEEDVGNPERAIKTAFVLGTESKLLYLTPSAICLDNGLEFTESMFNAITTGTTNNINVLPSALTKQSFHAAEGEGVDEKPAYIVLKLSGKDCFPYSYYTSTSLRMDLGEPNQDQPDIMQYVLGAVLDVQNASSGTPMLEYKADYGTAYEQLKINPTDPYYRDSLSSFPTGSLNRFSLIGLQENEKISEIVPCDEDDSEGFSIGDSCGEFYDELCTITHVDESNDFSIRFKYPDVRISLLLKTTSNRFFKVRFNSASSNEDSVFYLDDLSYHSTPGNSAYTWYLSTPRTENTEYKNKISERNFNYGIQKYTGATSWTTDADKYISSLKVVMENQIIDQNYQNEHGTATGVGADRVAWFVDEDGNVSDTGYLTCNGNGQYVSKIKCGYNTGVVLGKAYLKFKNTSSTPLAVRGKTLSLSFTYNVKDSYAYDGTDLEEPDYYLDSDFADMSADEANVKRRENFEMLQEYYTAYADAAKEHNVANCTMILPDDVTFLAENTDGSAAYLETNAWVSLSSAHTSVDSMYENPHAPIIKSGGINVNASDNTSGVFTMNGIIMESLSGESAVKGNGTAKISKCFMKSADSNDTTGIFIDATAAGMQVRECSFEISAVDHLMKLDTAYAADSCFEGNTVNLLGKAGTAEAKSLFEVTGTASNQLLSFVVQYNDFVNPAPTLVFSNNNSNDVRFDASNNYFAAGTNLVTDEDSIAIGLFARQESGNWNQSSTNQNIADFSGSLTQSLAKGFSGAGSNKSEVLIKNSELIKLPGIVDEDRYSICMYQTGEYNELYSLQFTPVVPGSEPDYYMAEGYFSPYGSVKENDTTIEGKLKSGFAGFTAYRVLELDQKCTFPTTTVASIPVPDSFTGGYFPVFKWENNALTETGTYAALDTDTHMLSFDATEGGIFVVASYAGVSALKLTDADGKTISENLSLTDETLELTLNMNAAGESALKDEDFEKVTVTNKATGTNNTVTVEKSTTDAGVINVTIPRGTYGKVTVTATYKNGNVTKTANAVVNMTAVTFDASTDITQGLCVGKRYNTATVLIQGPASQPFLGVHVLSPEISGNRNEVMSNQRIAIIDSKTEKAVGGVKATVTFDVCESDSYSLGDTEQNTLYFETAGEPYPVTIEVARTTVIAENDYRIVTIAGSDQAVFTGSSAYSVNVPDEITYQGSQVPVTAIAAGAMNCGIDGNVKTMGGTSINIGKNVEFIGVDADAFSAEYIEDTLQSGTVHYYAPICDGSGSFGRLEKIYVNTDNSNFKGNSFTVSDDVYDSGNDYNLYSNDGSILYEYPAFSKETSWMINNYLQGAEAGVLEKIAASDRKLRTIVLDGAQSLTNTDFLDNLNTGCFEQYSGGCNNYIADGGVLYYKVAEGKYELVSYPSAKSAEAILLTSMGQVTKIRSEALARSTISKLVIPADTQQEHEAFKINAKEIYLYGTSDSGYDPAQMSSVLSANKGTIIYADKTKYVDNAACIAWAKENGYTLKPLSVADTWTLKGKNAIKDLPASATVGTGKYMYLKVDDVIKVGDSENGFAVMQDGTNTYAQQTAGQVEYRFVNSYNDVRTQNNVFGVEDDSITFGSTLTVKTPGVKCVELYADETKIETLYLVAVPAAVSIPKAIDVLVAGNGINAASESSLLAFDSTATNEALYEYKELGLLTTSLNPVTPVTSEMGALFMGLVLSTTTPSMKTVKHTTTLLEKSYDTTITVLPASREYSVFIGDDSYPTEALNNGVVSSGVNDFELPVKIGSSMALGMDLPADCYTVASSNAAVLTVTAEEGRICLHNPNNKSGSVTLTVSLKDDPLKRTVKKTITVIDSQTVGFKFDLYNGNTKVSEINTQTATEASLTMDWDAENAQTLTSKNFVVTLLDGIEVEESDGYSIGWKSSNDKVLSYNSTNGKIDVKGIGSAYLTATLKKGNADDKSGWKATVYVTVAELSPTVLNSKYTVSKESLTGVKVATVMANGTEINWDACEVLDAQGTNQSQFSFTGSGDTGFLSTTAAVGTYKDYQFKLNVKETVTNTFYDITYNKITITVNEAAPKAADITAAVPSIDTFDWVNGRYDVTVSLKNGYELDTTREIVYGNENDALELEDTNDSGNYSDYKFKLKEDVSSSFSSKNFVKNITLAIPVKGYSTPISKTVTLSFTNKVPSAKADKTSLSIDTATSSPSAQLKMTYDSEIGSFTAVNGKSILTTTHTATKKLCEASGVDTTDIDVTLEEFNDYFNFEINNNVLEVVPGQKLVDGSYQFILKPTVHLGDVDLTAFYKQLNPITFTVTVKSAKPTTKMNPASLTLNRYAENVEQRAEFITSKDVLFDDQSGTIDVALISYPKTAEGDGVFENVALEGRYTPDGLYSKLTMVARPEYGAKTGTYKFSITPAVTRIDKTVLGGPTNLPAAILTVVVNETQPKITFDTSSVKLDNLYPETEYQMNMSSADSSDIFDTTSPIYRDLKTTDEISFYDPETLTEPLVEISDSRIIVKARPCTLAGTYSYYVAPRLYLKGSVYPTELKRQKITITVTSTRPTAKPSTSKLTLNNQYASAQSASVTYSADAELQGFRVEGGNAATQSVMEDNRLVVNDDGKNVLTVDVNSSVPTGTYTLKVVPIAKMTVRGSDYDEAAYSNGMYLTPSTLTVTVTSKAPTLKLATTTATLYPQYASEAQLIMQDTTNSVDDTAYPMEVFYLNKSGSAYIADSTQGTECYARIESMPNGDIRIHSTGAAQYLTKDLTVKNIGISRTLGIKQLNDASEALTDTQKITLVFKAATVPTALISKKTITLNEYFDFDNAYLSQPENLIRLSTTSASEDGVAGAYITKYDMTVSSPKNGNGDLGLVPVNTFDGTSSVVDFAVKPFYSSAVCGTYTFKLTPYISKVPATSGAYREIDAKKLASVTVTVKIVNTEPTAVFSKTAMTLNARNLNKTEIITAMTNDASIEFMEITPKSKPKNAVDGMVNLEGVQENGTITMTARVNDSNAPAGSYTFEAVPYVHTVYGGTLMLTKSKKVVTVNVVSKVPTASFQLASLKIDTTKSQDPTPSVEAKMCFSSELANLITDCSYTYQVTMPKGASEGDVFLETDVNEWDKLTVKCADSNVVPGTYKFSVTPAPVGGDADFNGIKPATLSVTVMNSNPKVTLSSPAVNLNALYGQQSTSSYIKLSADYDIAESETAVLQTSYPIDKKTKESTREAVDIYTVERDGVTYITAYATPDAMAGKYVFSITPVIHGASGNSISLKPVNYTVTVIRTLPTAKLKATTLTVNKLYDTIEQVTEVTIADAVYRNSSSTLTIDTLNTLTFTGPAKQKLAADLLLANNCFFVRYNVDSETNVLGVDLSGVDVPKGKYTFAFYPVIENEEGMKLTLAKQTITVDVTDAEPTIKLKTVGGKLDMVNRAASGITFQPTLSSEDGVNEQIVYSDGFISLAGDPTGTDYSDYFNITASSSDKTFTVSQKTDEEYLLNAGKYKLEVLFITQYGKQICVPVTLEVTKSACKIKATPAATILYTKTNDMAGDEIIVKNSSSTDAIASYVSKNENFIVTPVSDSNGNQIGFKLDFAGDRNGTDAEQLLAAKARAAYKSGTVVTVPVDVVLEGEATATTLSIKVTIK